MSPTALNAYFLTTDEFAAVGQAVDILRNDCMKKFGFTYPVGAFDTVLRDLRESESEADSRLFGPTDRAAAAKYGYMPASLYEGSAATRSPSEQSAAYLKVLNAGHLPGTYQGTPQSVGEVDGVQIPPGGCNGSAILQVTGSYDGLSTGLGRDLWIQAHSRAQADPRWQSVVADWASCVSKSGYHVTDPVDDQGDIKKMMAQDGDGRASRRQIDLALVDIDCKKQTKLVARLATVVEKYADKAVESNQLALEEDRKRLDKLLKTSTEVIKASTQ